MKFNSRLRCGACICGLQVAFQREHVADHSFSVEEPYQHTLSDRVVRLLWVLTEGENLIPLFSFDAPTPAAVGLLGLRVRIPPGSWMSAMSVVCYQVVVSVGPITGPEEFYRGRCV